MTSSNKRMSIIALRDNSKWILKWIIHCRIRNGVIKPREPIENDTTGGTGPLKIFAACTKIPDFEWWIILNSELSRLANYLLPYMYNVVFYVQRKKHPTEIYLRQMSICLSRLRLTHRKICDNCKPTITWVLLMVWNHYLWEQRLESCSPFIFWAQRLW